MNNGLGLLSRFRAKVDDDTVISIEPMARLLKSYRVKEKASSKYVSLLQGLPSLWSKRLCGMMTPNKVVVGAAAVGLFALSGESKAEDEKIISDGTKDVDSADSEAESFIDKMKHWFKDTISTSAKSATDITVGKRVKVPEYESADTKSKDISLDAPPMKIIGMPAIPGPSAPTSSTPKGPAAQSPVAPPSGQKFFKPRSVPTLGSNLIDAFEEAEKATGVKKQDLTTIAYLESNFNASALAGTSSAGGIMQFTKGTWIETVAKYGARHGITEADRLDGRASIIMGAYLTRDSYIGLRKSLSADPTITDIYMAHFLGLVGATQFISALKRSPGMAAADVFPKAAAANKPIFYDGSSPRTLQGMYEYLGGKVQRATVVAARVLDKGSSEKATQVAKAPSATSQQTTTVSAPIVALPAAASGTTTPVAAPVAASFNAPATVQTAQATPTTPNQASSGVNVVTPKSEPNYYRDSKGRLLNISARA